MARDDKGAKGHPISHTDAARGKGGGQLTQSADDLTANPASQQAEKGGENGKAAEARSSKDRQGS